VVAVVSEVVLPALGMFPANLALAEMVWDVLAPLPFPVRAEVSGLFGRTQPACC
jgi:hypothetical protein